MTLWTESLTHQCSHSSVKLNGCLDSRRWSTVVVGWVGHVGNPRGVVQALCEQGVMSLPFARLLDQRWGRNLRSEQIGEQDDGVAVRTTASESDRARIQIAVFATALAEEVLATPRTLVNGMRHQQPLALELLAEDDRIHRG